MSKTGITAFLPDGGADRSFFGVHCLVLGGGGFLGTALSNALADRGAVVQAFGRSVAYPEALDRRVVRTVGDFAETAALAKAVAGQDLVFHLISATVPESSNRDPCADLVANAFHSLRLLDVCRAEKIAKIIFVSSGGAVYGVPSVIPIPETAPTNPISAYGVSKLAIEKYLALYRHLYGIEYQILRVANTYGKYQAPQKKQGVVAAMVHRALAGQPLEIWGTGEVVRDFIHVDDVVEALLRVTFYRGLHPVMNVGSGVGRCVNEVVRDIEMVIGCGELPKIYRDIERKADVPINVLDYSLIAAETGWSPRVSWIDGLDATVKWMRGNELR